MPEGAVHTVAVVGAGIGAEHVAGYGELPDRFRVATICDLDAGRAAMLARRVPGCVVATDVDLVLRDPSIDVVDVCVPPSLHAELARRALAAGKHVVCEKPLAGSLRAVDRLIADARAAGRILAPVFQYRYGPGMAGLRALRAAGLAGRPQVASLETHWDRGADYYAVPWRGTRAGELGGAVLGHAIHIHDLLSEAMGPVARVLALTATRVNDIEVEDCAALAFELEGGALASSSITLGAAGNVTRLRFCFEHVTVESGLEPYRPASVPWTFRARDPARQGAVDTAVAGALAGPAAFAGFFAELHRALVGERAAAPLTAAGRRSIELVTAIYRAARQGQAVCLPVRAQDPDYDGWGRASAAG